MASSLVVKLVSIASRQLGSIKEMNDGIKWKFRLPLVSADNRLLAKFTRPVPSKALVFAFSFERANGEMIDPDSNEELEGLTWSPNLGAWYQYNPQVQTKSVLSLPTFQVPAGSRVLRVEVRPWEKTAVRDAIEELALGVVATQSSSIHNHLTVFGEKS